MAIKINCENGHRLNAPENLLGKRVKCPKCGVPVLITTDGALPPSSVSQHSQSPNHSSAPTNSPETFPDFGVSGFEDMGPPPDNALSNFDFASLPLSPVLPAPQRMEDPLAAPPLWGSRPATQSQPVTQSVQSAPWYSAINIWWLMGSILGGGVMGLATLFVIWLINAETSKSVKAVDNAPLAELAIDSTKKVEPSEVAIDSTKKLERPEPATDATKKLEPSPQPVFKSSASYESFLRDRSKTDISDSNEFTLRQKDRLLANQFVKFLDAQAEAGEVERAKVNEDEIRYAKVPFFLMTTETEFANIRGNTKDPNVKTRIELLEFGMKEFEIDRWADVGQEDTAASERVYADMLAYRWRHYLMIKKTELNEATYRLVRHIEDTCFGKDSLFYGFNLTDDNQVLTRIAAQLESIGRGLDEVDSIGLNPNGFPAIQTGKLSWRVALLPYVGSYNADNMDSKTLYKEFRLDEPWDSEANLKLVEKMPDIYQTDKVKQPGFTAFHMIMHERGLFRPGVNEKVEFQDHSKGGPTPLVILGGVETAEPWPKPGGLLFEETKDASQFGTPPIRNYYPFVSYGVPFARYFVKHTPQENLGDLFFIDDGTQDARAPSLTGWQLKSYLSDLAPLQNKFWQQAWSFEKKK